MREYVDLNIHVRNESDSWNVYNRFNDRLWFRERFECERMWWDPKDGELYLNRVKSGETLVEARNDTDVQIVRLTWI